ncbi:type I restriction enzyme S subunit [Gelidibacter sediminis]|uniref:Type I restriction enzyme S subunit n=1 Tax=Gelidibacter sediminis TaxID=1608710 RepID=A0A4R7PZ87_9FLAO|nr:restriction endonuclease subunit S [Gelidibacter sediminis]TDU40355.1 type I restriction enzyme S subunit [Gelidibacter sediminis]
MRSGHIKISRFNEGLTVFKPDYYLNRGKKVISDLLDKGIANSSLADLADKLYQGGIFKRVFVENENFAHQYITASDMVKTQPLDTAKNISVKYTPWVDEMTLRDKQILVSCAGTVGNTTLVNDSFSGCIGSQEIIRIETSQVPYGFLYAYLSAPIVNEYIQSMIYGAVVPRISPEELGRLPVLLPEEPKQQQIHNLIVEASKLRVEANKLLKEAQSVFETKIVKKDSCDKYRLVSSQRLKSELRLGGNYFLSIGDDYERQILSGDYKFLKDFATSIFTGGRDKRNYTTKERGLPFLSNGDISSSNPFRSCNYIVKKSVKNNSKIKENMILTGRVGQDTVGKVYLPFEELIDTIASDNIIRIQLKNDEDIFYVYAFLSSKAGNEIIRKRKSGVGQPFVTEEMFYDIPIPCINENEMALINQNVKQYRTKIDKALKLELEAINLIENEIEQWQES